MKTQLVLLLIAHRKLGIVPAAYRTRVSEQGNFLTITERLMPHDEDYQNFQKTEQEIIRLCEKCSDDYIYNHFSKKKLSYTDFFRKLDNYQTLKLILPHLEKNLELVLNLLKMSRFRLFYSNERPTNLYSEDEIKIFKEPALAVFNFIRTKDYFRYFLTVEAGGQEIHLLDKTANVLLQNPCVMIADKKLLSFTDIDSNKLKPFFSKDFVSIPKTIEEKYFSGFVKNAVKNYKVNAFGFKIEKIIGQPEKILQVQQGLNGSYEFTLSFQYNPDFKPKFYSRQKSYVELKIEGDEVTFYQHLRNTVEEQKAIEFLKSSGLKAEQKQFILRETSVSLEDCISWIADHNNQLVEAGFIIDEEVEGRNYILEKPQMEIRIGHKPDWFDIDGIIHIADSILPLNELRDVLLKGSNSFTLKSGRSMVIPGEWKEKYGSLFELGQVKEGKLRLKNTLYHLLAKDHTDNLQRIKKQFAELDQDKTGKDTESHIPETSLTEKLRPYQKEGLDWMLFLRKNKFGGCLADDMGLGKTIQTLALLQLHYLGKDEDIDNAKNKTGTQLALFAEKSRFKEVIKPVGSLSASLIVVPTSLIHNWEDEIKKFTPQFTYYIYYGKNRKLYKNLGNLFNKYHLIISSYGVVRQDAEFLKNYRFSYLICDESQSIKNPYSKTYQAVLEIDATIRLALSGTPIENTLQDLWAQMNFLNPGLLGNLNYFSKKYINALEKGNNEIRNERLKNIIRPFLLRRKKEDVAKDLPDLMIQNHYCPMEDDQAELYAQIRDEMRSRILLDQKQAASLQVLQALTMLRQLACHPRLLYPEQKYSSGKFYEVIRMLRSVLAEGHKVLLFSSFVKHLELYKKYFEAREQSYAFLTGQTRNRKQVIDEFRTNPECSVFLISIKAGGVGLNLTEADYIFILDPWWNPAVEMQAISRAHRIGQDKPVFVYRFVSEQSIEEKIHQLQENKNHLASEFVDFENEGKALSPKILEEFFKESVNVF